MKEKSKWSFVTSLSPSTTVLFLLLLLRTVLVSKENTLKWIDQMMANQRSLTEEDLTKYATNISLDLDKWKTCRKDPKQEAEVKKDMADGAVAGVSGTPAFFINGIMLSGVLRFLSIQRNYRSRIGQG